MIVSLALVANLIAAGVPVLHAWTHEVHASAHEDGHGHDEVPSASEGDHPHDEAHPLALHDDCLLVHRTAFDLALALPTARVELESFVTDDAPSRHPVLPVASRAPPSSGPARAPPLV